MDSQTQKLVSRCLHVFKGGTQGISGVFLNHLAGEISFPRRIVDELISKS